MKDEIWFLKMSIVSDVYCIIFYCFFKCLKSEILDNSYNWMKKYREVNEDHSRYRSNFIAAFFLFRSRSFKGVSGIKTNVFKQGNILDKYWIIFNRGLRMDCVLTHANGLYSNMPMMSLASTPLLTLTLTLSSSLVCSHRNKLKLELETCSRLCGFYECLNWSILEVMIEDVWWVR